MKLLHLILLAGFAWWIGMAPLPAQQVKIMSYNIHHGKDSEGRNMLPSMGDFIAQMDVDLVALQEVDSVCERSYQTDQVDYLAERTSMPGYFTRHFEFQGGAYGQALISGLTVDTFQNFRLPVFPLDQGREVSVLIADIHLDDHKHFTLAVLHLDYRSAESRLHQIDLLWDSLAHIDNLILAGDFNSLPDSPEMDKVLCHFDRYVFEPETFTFPAIDANRRIDYILVKKGCQLRIISEQVPEVPYSDHLPVITTLEWISP